MTQHTLRYFYTYTYPYSYTHTYIYMHTYTLCHSVYILIDALASTCICIIVLRVWKVIRKWYKGLKKNKITYRSSCHHHIVLAARISLTLSRHSSLSFIALGRSSGQHPVSSHSCWMYVRAGRPAFARPCVGIHKSTSLMSSSLLLQQCPACLVRLTWIDFVIGGRWPYSWCLVGCRCQDLLRIARSMTELKGSLKEFEHRFRQRNILWRFPRTPKFGSDKRSSKDVDFYSK